MIMPIRPGDIEFVEGQRWRFDNGLDEARAMHQIVGVSPLVCCVVENGVVGRITSSTVQAHSEYWTLDIAGVCGNCDAVVYQIDYLCESCRQ